jgi:predicted alpha/beta-fold hydrolase
VAQWLKEEHRATRVGLVSFSLSAYESMLTAWLDGERPVTDLTGVPLLKDLPGPCKEPAFNGGMFIVSAPVGIVGLADRFQPKLEMLDAPCKATFQEHVAERLESYNEEPAYSMWALTRSELIRAGLVPDVSQYEQVEKELLQFIDFSAGNWQTGAARMENVRIPMLVLSAANDPLGTAQGVADLFGRVRNPNVGVILLKEGGHMGFSALSADYYYSLMTNFFDPATAPQAVPPEERTVSR